MRPRRFGARCRVGPWLRRRRSGTIVARREVAGEVAAARVLGRTQVLEHNAVAPMGQLATVRTRMEGLRPRVRFEPGMRYTDFVPIADRVAAYGIGALVAGKVVAKTGRLKGLLALLIAGKKLVAAAVVAAAAELRSRFSRRSNDAPPPADS